MNDDIIVIGGEQEVRVIFLFAIPVPKTYQNGDNATVTAVPTPAPEPGDVRELLSTAEIAALDAGQGAWEVRSFQVDKSMTTADVAAAIRAEYQRRRTIRIAEYNRLYNFRGTRVAPTV